MILIIMPFTLQIQFHYQLAIVYHNQMKYNDMYMRLHNKGLHKVRSLISQLFLFQINGTLTNTGNDLTFRLADNSSKMANVSDGPLMYSYKVDEVKLHFGKKDTEGSEHSIDNSSFAAEVEI